ncbi:aminotransferase class I/II-fold pyridoxal phosphate-dependent enzyme [Sodalis glossinidius]|uniref:aminotransferase class I/II-fold pyridoxal phosphate-dependent enzyme n=1 Tax=Sodalis glossinidius TaxID=63612 RepID=UPI000309BD66|nr:aminotransferase class I/II-fold pyridoxal phosphate-dependent enzyme [Sodalis glossinidius]
MNSPGNPSGALSLYSAEELRALAELNGPQTLLPEWCGRLRQRRNVALSILCQAPALNVAMPPAAFYLFVDCRALIGKRTPSGETLHDDVALAAYLLEHAEVAVVPGSSFGIAHHFRIAYSIADDRVALACERIIAACGALG